MTIDTVEFDIVEAMQSLNRSISGIQAPPPGQYPTTIDTTNGQPFVMTWPGDGEDWQKICFLDPVAQSDIPSHALDGMAILRKLKNLYINSANTPLINPGAFQATIESGPTGPHITDTGLIPTLSFGGRAWFGFEIPVPIRWQGAQL